MKKSLAFAALLLTAAPVCVPACAQARTRVFVSMARVDPFLSLIRDSLQAEAAKNPDLDMTIAVANDQVDTQLSQVKAAIADHTDVLVVLSVDDNAARQLAAASAASKTPLVYLNVLPPIDRFTTPTSIVASNDLVAGRLQMRLLADKIGNKGNVVILRGADSHPAARDRTAGVKEILAQRPDIHVVGDVSCDWKRDEAEKQVTVWLQSGVHIDAIAANNDEMALGAIAALQKAGYPAGKVAVGGVDGTADGLAAIKSGYLTMSLLQNAREQAAEAMADVKKLAQGQYAQLYDWVPYEIIIPSNLASFEH